MFAGIIIERNTFVFLRFEAYESCFCRSPEYRGSIIQNTDDSRYLSSRCKIV